MPWRRFDLKSQRSLNVLLWLTTEFQRSFKVKDFFQRRFNVPTVISSQKM